MFAVHGRVAAFHDVPRLNIIVDDVSALNDNRLRRIEEAARLSRGARRNFATTIPADGAR